MELILSILSGHIPMLRYQGFALITPRTSVQELTQKEWAWGGEEEERCLQATGSHILKRDY